MKKAKVARKIESGGLRRVTQRTAPIFGALFFAAVPSLAAAPCTDLSPVNPVYGAGGAAFTATIGAVATVLVGLPDADRVTIFYNDPGACTGYGSFLNGGSTVLTFKYWDAAGSQGTCEAPASQLSFAHMGNTPLLCPGNQSLPDGFKKVVAPVQTINLITHADSDANSISAEALYHIYGFGPGASGRSVAPWTDANAVFGRTPSSLIHQLLAAAIRVPAADFQLDAAQFTQTTVSDIFSWGQVSDPNEPLGYVSSSAADLGEESQQVKTLAYQHFGQSCAYLPDSARSRKDKLNVRTGQYYLWTPAWFYAKVDNEGALVNAQVQELIGWFGGALPAPDGVDIQEIIIGSGDIPLCAMQAIRTEGDLSDIQSFAPDAPCNGYFEFVATGSTDYEPCNDNDDCAGEGNSINEICSFGYCELAHVESN